MRLWLGKDNRCGNLIRASGVLVVLTQLAWSPAATGESRRDPEGTPEDTLSAALSRARDAAAAGEVSAAIEMLEDLTRAAPTSGPVRSALAEAYEQAGDLGRARQSHGRAVELAPDDIPLCQSAFAFYVRTGQLLEGAAVFAKVRGAHPEWPVQRTMYANLLNGVGRAEQAEAEFQAIADLANGDITKASDADRLHIGSACVLVGRAQQATSTLQPVVHHAPDAAPGHFWYGRALAIAGQIDRAGEHLRRAIELAPRDESFALGHAEFCLDSMLPQAEEAVEHLLDLRPDLIEYRVRLTKQLQDTGMRAGLGRQQLKLAEVAERDGWMDLGPEQRLFVGAACVETGQGGLAVRVLEDLLDDVPDVPAHRLWLARAYALVGRDEEAIRLFRAGIEHNPNSSELWLELARLYRRSSRSTDEMALLREMIDRSVSPILATTHLADLLAAVGQAEEADALLGANADLADRGWDALTRAEQLHVAAANVRAKRTDKAVALLRRMIDDGADSADARRWLSRAYAQVGDGAAAVEQLLLARALAPDDEEIVREAAEALWARGDTEEAVRVLKEWLGTHADGLAVRVRVYQWLTAGQQTAELAAQERILAARASRPDWPELPVAQLLFIGAACVNTGQGALGVEVLEQVVARRADVAAHHLWLGKAYRAVGRHDESLLELAKALELAPTARGTVRECCTQAQLAGADWGLVEDLDTQPVPERRAVHVARLLQGSCYSRLGQPDRAVEILEALVGDAADAIKVSAYLILAESYASQGERTKADEALARAARIQQQRANPGGGDTDQP